jgi:DNA polymerase III subunit delta'
VQFSDIPGLEEVKQQLVQAVDSNHLAHALLFYGPEGSGVLGLALALATYVNCENKDLVNHDACGVCPSCTKIKKLIHPDLSFVYPYANIKEALKAAKGDGGKTELSSDTFLPEWRKFIEQHPYGNLSDWAKQIEADNKAMLIPVEESRQIIRKLTLKSYEAEYKIMLIWLPEVMRQEAANAILKVLEEPPYKTLFLLVAQQPDAIITTILSRTQKVRVRPFTDEEIAQFLIEKLSFSSQEAHQKAFLADGSIRKAMSLAEGTSSDVGMQFRDWLRVCFMSSKLNEGLEWADTFAAMTKDDQKGFFQMGLNYFREGLLVVNEAEEILRLEEEEKDFIKKLGKFLSNEKIEQMLRLFSEAISQIDRNANVRILMTDLYFKTHSLFNNQ